MDKKDIKIGMRVQLAGRVAVVEKIWGLRAKVRPAGESAHWVKILGLKEITKEGGNMETKLNLKCSWCLSEQGIPPDENDSHGICERHYEMLMDEMSHDEKKGGDDDQ